MDHRVELIARDIDVIEAAREIRVLVTTQHVDLADKGRRVGVGSLKVRSPLAQCVLDVAKLIPDLHQGPVKSVEHPDYQPIAHQ